MSDSTYRLIMKAVGFDKADKKTKKLSGSLGTLAKRAGAVAGAFFGASAVLSGAKQSLELFGRQEQAVRKLDQALGKNTSGLQAYASQLQQVTRFGDEATIEQMAFLGSIGMTEAQIKKIIPVAMDLATATGMSLESAVRNTAKTFSGMAGELGELVPQLRELTAEQMKAGDAVDIMEELFGGQAQADAQSYAGSMDQLSNALGDIGEVVGGYLAPAMQNIAEWFVDLTETELSETMYDTRLEAVALMEAMEDVNVPLELQKEYADQLAKEYPELDQQYKNLKKSGMEASDAIDAISESLLNEYILQNQREKIDEAVKNQAKAWKDNRDAVIGYKANLLDLQTITGGAVNDTMDMEEALDSARKALEGYNYTQFGNYYGFSDDERAKRIYWSQHAQDIWDAYRNMWLYADTLKSTDYDTYSQEASDLREELAMMKQELIVITGLDDPSVEIVTDDQLDNLIEYNDELGECIELTQELGETLAKPEDYIIDPTPQQEFNQALIDRYNQMTLDDEQMQTFLENNENAIDIISALGLSVKNSSLSWEQYGKLRDKQSKEEVEATALQAQSWKEGALGVIQAEIAKATAILITKILSGVPYPFNLILAGTAGGAVNALMSDVVAKNLAEGYDGVVTSPTLFRAGEQGAERIQVTNLTKEGGGIDSPSGSGSIVINAEVATEEFMDRVIDYMDNKQSMNLA